MKPRDAEDVLNMFRNSGRGDRVLKGTSNQKGVDFELRHIAWITGVNVRLWRAPDRNRFLRHELLEAEKGRHGELRVPPLRQLRDLGQRLLAIAIRYCQRAGVLADEIRSRAYRGIDSRVVESYSIPAGILAAMMGVDQDGVEEFQTTLLSCVPRTGAIKDETDLLESILAGTVQTKQKGQRSPGQLLQTISESVTGDLESEECLEHVGIRLSHFTPKDARTAMKDPPAALSPCLILAQKPISDRLLRGGEWAGQAIEQILSRLPTAIQSRRKVGGLNQSVVLLGLDYVRDSFLNDSESADGQTDGKNTEF